MKRSKAAAEHAERTHHNPLSTPDFTEHREARCEVRRTVAVFFRRKGGKPPMPRHRKHLFCLGPCQRLTPHRELAPEQYQHVEAA